MKRLEWIFLILGLLLFVALLNHVGWGEVLHQFAQVGWSFLLVLGVSGLRYTLRTAAWRRVFSERADKPPFHEMFQARLAGETMNYLTVAGPLASEPTKAALLRQRLPFTVSLGSGILEGSTYTFTSGLVILAGLVLGLLRLALDESAQQAGWVVAILLAAALGAGWWIVRRRIHFIGTALEWLRRSRVGRWVEPRRRELEEAEARVLDFYRLHLRDFRAMFFWDCGAQLCALAEIWVILRALGFPIGWSEVLIFEGMTKVFKLIFFFVPARVGTDEAATAVISRWLGYGLGPGVGLALVRRLRALVWTALGVALLGRYAVRRTA